MWICGFFKQFLLEKGRKSGRKLDGFLYGIWGIVQEKKKRKIKEDSAGFK